MAKQRQSYFDQAVRDLGENFLSFKDVTTIQRDAKKRIFKDMAFGNINYEKYGIYFMDPRFIDNLIIAAEDEMTNHMYKAQSLYMFDMANPGIQKVIALQAFEARLWSAFTIIWQHMSYIKNTNYSDISQLPNLTFAISQYAQDIASL